MLRITGSHPSA